MSLEILRPDGTQVIFHDDDTITYTKHTLEQCDGCEQYKPKAFGIGYAGLGSDSIVLWLCGECVELQSGKSAP